MQKTAANPQLKWAQRKDKVYITFDLFEVQNPQIDIVDGKVLKFSGTDKNHTYSLELEFFEEISKEDSKYIFATRNIFLNLKKKEKGDYWPRLTKNTGKLNEFVPDMFRQLSKQANMLFSSFHPSGRRK